MIIKIFRFLLQVIILGGVLIAAAGCSAIQPVQPTPTASLPAPTNTPISTPLPTLEVDAPDALIPIVIWLPPQFNPELENTASQLLNARLAQFSQDHPQLAIIYRIKNRTGPAGLLDSLTVTSKVASQSLPDLVLFPDEELRTALKSSLIYPYPANSQLPTDSDWYQLAKEMSYFQDETYSLPLGVDALVMIYNSRLTEDIPTNWDELLRSGYLFSFPAGDPNAIFTHALYLSQGGQLSDEQNPVLIQTEPLARVLEFYAQAGSNTLLPSDIIQIDSDDDSWERFVYGGRQMTVSWASRYLSLFDENLRATPLLTQDSTTITLVKGWGWALTNPDPNKQLVAAELARWLTDAEFVGEWTQAAHLLPLRPSALNYWADENYRTLANQLLPVAQMVPNKDILAITGPNMKQAVIQTLAGELSAQEAAELASYGQD